MWVNKRLIYKTFSYNLLILIQKKMNEGMYAPEIFSIFGPVLARKTTLLTLSDTLAIENHGKKEKLKKNTYTLLFPFDRHFSVSFFLWFNFWTFHIKYWFSFPFFEFLPLANCHNNNFQTSLFFYPWPLKRSVREPEQMSSI